MSDDDLTHELARLRNENATLKAQAAKGITMKVSALPTTAKPATVKAGRLKQP